MAMLKQSEVVHYLVSLGVVKPSAVVARELAVVDASRRHHVFITSTRAGPTFVVKQATRQNASSLAHEACALRALEAVREFRANVPAVVHDDPQAALLVLRTPGGARTWSEHHGAG